MRAYVRACVCAHECRISIRGISVYPGGGGEEGAGGGGGWREVGETLKFEVKTVIAGIAIPVYPQSNKNTPRLDRQVLISHSPTPHAYKQQ